MPESTSPSDCEKTPVLPSDGDGKPAAPLAPVAEKIGESTDQLGNRAARFKKQHGRTPTSSSTGRP